MASVGKLVFRDLVGASVVNFTFFGRFQILDRLNYFPISARFLS